MNYKNEKNKEIENEVLNSDERKIAGMLGNLKQIEAPKDFDYRLKARIANAKPESHRPAAFFPVLRYVMPLGLFLIVGGALMWNGGMNVDNESVPSVAETVQPIVPVAIARPAQVEIGSSNAAPSVTSSQNGSFIPVKIENAVARQPKMPVRKGTKISSNGFMSEDKGLGVAPKPILQRGVSTEPVMASTAPKIQMQFTEREVLLTIGVEAQFEGKGWKVGSVAKGSLADSSGIRAGDSIEAMNGEALGNKKIFNGGFSAKAVKVVRDSKDLEISLKP